LVLQLKSQFKKKNYVWYIVFSFIFLSYYFFSLSSNPQTQLNSYTCPSISFPVTHPPPSSFFFSLSYRPLLSLPISFFFSSFFPLKPTRTCASQPWISDALTDGVDLGVVTSALDEDAHVDASETVSSKEEDGLQRNTSQTLSSCARNIVRTPLLVPPCLLSLYTRNRRRFAGLARCVCVCCLLCVCVCVYTRNRRFAGLAESNEAL
jgi:hypothetical protein